MARLSRACGVAGNGSPRSRIRMFAPLPAKPLAIVAPPMPEPMMTMSGAMTSDDAPFRGRIEEDGLRQVEGKKRIRTRLDVGVGAQPGDHPLAAEIGDGESVRPGRLHHFDMAVGGGDGRGIALGAVRIGQRLRAYAEDYFFTLEGGKAGRRLRQR